MVINRYSELARHKNRFAEGHYYISRSFFLMGDAHKAVEHLEKAVEFDTDEVDHHYSFGMLFTAMLTLSVPLPKLSSTVVRKDARQNLGKALKLEPQNQKFIKIKNELGL